MVYTSGMRLWLSLLLLSCAPTPTLGPCPVCPETSSAPLFCVEGLSPSEVLGPSPGSLYYRQLGLPGRSLGESALIVGPDGVVILLDVGNDSHAKEIAAAVKETRQQMNRAGFSVQPENQVDHIILTHLHADHIGGIGPLLERISLRGAIIHRGMFDLTESANFGEAEELCLALESHQELALCEGAARAPCDSSLWTESFPASQCDNLSSGDLFVEGDAGASFVSLGVDSSVSFLAANGFIGAHSFEGEVEPILRKDSNGENARSLMGVVSHGVFRMIFAGDLTGGGEETNAVEGFYIEHLGEVAPELLSGVEVLHANHHGRDTSSSLDWSNTFLPADGRARNIIAGISGGHLNSPQENAVDTLISTLSGGFFWTTQVTLFGAEDNSMQDADGGDIVLKTFDGGRSYVLQRLDRKGRLLESQSFVSAQCGL
jgi:hypothetical protein